MERLFFIICVGPKYLYKCPYERNYEGDSIHSRGKSAVKTELEIRMLQPPEAGRGE